MRAFPVALREELEPLGPAAPVDRLAVCCNLLRAPALLLVIALAGHALWQNTPTPPRTPGPPPSGLGAAVADPFPDPVGLAGGPAARVDHYQRWLAQLKCDNPTLYRIYLTDFAAENARLHLPGQWSHVDLNKVWSLALNDYHGAPGKALLPPPASLGPCPPCK